MDNVSSQRLTHFIERVEAIEDTIDDAKIDRKAIYDEAKNEGFDIRAMRILVRLRKIDTQKRIRDEGILESYRTAIGL